MKKEGQSFSSGCRTSSGRPGTKRRPKGTLTFERPFKVIWTGFETPI